MIKISIIMPVYNAEKTVSRMIDSIIAQTFMDWELICVDDGSTDSSGKILDDYAAKDSRIKVFHKENEGVAMARQMGIDNACGEYSIHADADDWMEQGMLKSLYQKATDCKADIIICDYFTSYSDGQEKYNKQIVPSLKAPDILMSIFDGFLGALWNKLLRTSLYKKYDARFYKGINYCEDVLIWAQIMQYSEVKVEYLNEAFYHYCVVETSITHTHTKENYKVLLRYQEKLNEILSAKIYQPSLDKLSMGLYKGAIFGGFLSHKEVYSGLFKNLKAIIKYNKSGRWFLCFILIFVGLYDVAHRISK